MSDQTKPSNLFEIGLAILLVLGLAIGTSVHGRQLALTVVPIDLSE